ncbi:putative Golgi reassembly stacking protein (GRASP-like) [Leptomonas pyrrhocoris]|uniref:Putative Golgi reassembly stacking protein (GRASP-like) n=1 Tax=Leptomonas pyrrhocoris TaxID=157538 RepID=A0A0M9G2G4_LEPPY|nr:putative Golgi reassembly stacking protein (GRASP-like) [Leptomonas pyrrhocoris]KPA81070.1 putative Golgi reassembly stacking protein (GRASP-like) [Leptomonas pyrrhocoris]|eukprot:XP_015659509.1 putative Golgi reassembly stacking protein (GRASP-like) [Leptomonas pyrrhocoris]
MGQDQSRTQNGQAAATRTQVPAGVAGSQGAAVATVPLTGIEGFQVVRLLPYSPAHKAGLVPYFDLITSLDHVPLESEGKPALQFFKSYIANHRDQPICFTVFNLHIRAYRDVYCVPSDAWGGGGLLGCSVEWSRAEGCLERCVHVVDVLEGSPAAYSGELQANRDYIIGMQTAQEPLISLIKSQKDFYSRLEDWHEEQRWALERQQRFPNEAVDLPHILLFLVYNSESNTVKEVAVEMGTNPEAALGMSVATGLLHIVPSATTTGDAATADSLPIMNKFVRLEADRAITSTPGAPAPATLPPPPSFLAQQLPPQQDQQYPQPDAQPHPEENHVPQAYYHEGEEAYEAPIAAAPAAASAQPPLPPRNASAASAGAPPHYNSFFPTPPAPQHQKHQPHAPVYAKPAFFNEDVVPPPCNHAPTASVEPSSHAAALPPPPPPPPPPTTSSANSSKRNSFRLALASVESYERPPHAVAHPTDSAPPPSKQAAAMNHLPPPPPRLPQPHVESRAPPSGAQPPSQQQHAMAMEEVAPPVVPPHTAAPAGSPAPIVSLHDTPILSSVSPLPPRQQQQPQLSAAQRGAFSIVNMPPPLKYPVFPGAAMKHQQK